MQSRRCRWHEIKIYDEVIQCVQEYIYLGQKIGACIDHEKEIKRRIGMGWSSFGRQHNIMKNNLLLLKKKINHGN